MFIAALWLSLLRYWSTKSKNSKITLSVNHAFGIWAPGSLLKRSWNRRSNVNRLALHLCNSVSSWWFLFCSINRLSCRRFSKRNLKPERFFSLSFQVALKLWLILKQTLKVCKGPLGFRYPFTSVVASPTFLNRHCRNGYFVLLIQQDHNKNTIEKLTKI